MSGDRPIVIAGAGIGGLTLAIALARQGLPSRVLERRSELAEAGAGIQIGPNAVGVLSRAGVAERLEPSVGKPECLRVHDGGSGQCLAELPLGDWIAKRHQAPYWVAHRADLHAALLATATALPLIEITTACEVVAFAPKAGGVEVRTADGSRYHGALLVGADGIWSGIRKQLRPDFRLTYSGKTASRAVVDRADAPAPFRKMATGVWLSPAGHVVHYPVRGGHEIALVVILKEGWPGEGWGLPVDQRQLIGRLGAFSDRLTAFLSSADDWRRWPLYDPEPLPRWSQGIVTLLGDAAHPVLPFLAQGGALAIEDAETLAAAIRMWRSEPAVAIDRYERARRPRAIRMQAASRCNGLIYHLPKPASLARDLTLRAMPGQSLMALYDWVYGWRPETL